MLTIPALIQNLKPLLSHLPISVFSCSHSRIKPAFFKNFAFIALFMAAGSQSSFALSKHKYDRNSERNRMLDEIEAVMFLFPENLDSMVNLIDTTSLTPFEQARLGSIRGKMYRDKSEFPKSIEELEKADSIFIFYKNTYHQYLNKFLKASVLEYLQLYNHASELYIECDHFFDKNQNDKFKFYASLGILRMNNILKISTKEIISEIENSVRNFKDPLFTGLFYSTLGYNGANDSISLKYFELAKSEFIKAQAWSRAYATELNILIIKIRLYPPEMAQVYYDAFHDKDFQYIPNPEQKTRFLLAKGQLLVYQKEYQKAIEATKEALDEARTLKQTGSEVYCLNLLAFLYSQIGDFNNAHKMLVRYINLKNKENESLEQARIQALGAHYRFTKLENERLKLKTKLQKNKLGFGGVFLIFSILVIAILKKLKKKKLEKDILTLKNIAIEDQIANLLHSLEISEEKNVELIELTEELELKYLDSKEISEFSHKIEINNIASWLEFENHFSNQRPDWVELLKEKAPGLSPTDIKYCVCICVNLNNFEISRLLKVSDNSVKSAKRRIRNKLALNSSREIYLFLRSLAQ